MAKKDQTKFQQPALDFSDGKPKQIPVAEGDIGGELLPILSKGLYTNTLDCIREYVQNGVDAGAKSITIKVTGNSVIIYDNGAGMNMQELIEARRFGISPKRPDRYVGFRGIGIYSGYDLSNRLVLTTKKKGESKECVMRFNFLGMKQELEQIRNRQGNNNIPLNQLLSKHTSFSQQDADDANAHYTIVQLEEISDVHVYRLSDRTELRNYILQNLPVDFDPSFEYKKLITKNLKANVPDYKAVEILLQSDEEEDENVFKPNIGNLQEPLFGLIENKNKDVIAYYWACLSEYREKISEKFNIADKKNKPPVKLSDYQGFIYKCKGFTVGNRQKLRVYFTVGSGNLYHRYTGEIYVIDPELIPNAERDDFETSPAKAELELAVGDTLRQLSRIANTFQNQGVANEKITENANRLTELERSIANKSLSLIDALVALDTIIKEVRKQEANATSEKKEEARALIVSAQRLDKQLRQRVSRTRSDTRRGASSSAANNSGAATSSTGANQARNASTSTANGSALEEVQSFTEVVQSLELATPEEFLRAIEVIGEVVAQNLGEDSEEYRTILNEVDERLQSEFES